MPTETDNKALELLDVANEVSTFDTEPKERKTDITGKAPPKKKICVNDLEKRVCYFSLAGDQALKAFEKYYIEEGNIEKHNEALKSAVIQRLYFAVAMFDVVVFHCSDPLRSPLIKEILNEHSNWISEGRIRFIAGHEINDWASDYDKYIDRKYNDYQKGFYAELEAQSLRQNHIDTEYKENVKALLSKSQYYIQKDPTANSQFISLLKEDIKHNNEQIVIGLDCEEDNMFAGVKQFAVQKTVYQLLHAKYYSEASGNKIQDVFDADMVKEVFTKVRKALERGQAVARPAIVEALKERITELSELQEAIFDAITLRMDLLYCRMNAGKHLILEFHPSYEQQTLYKLKCFEYYLRKFGYHQGLDTLSKERIDNLINSNVIENFRRIFLASMADTHEQNNFTMKIWSDKTVFDDRCKRLLPPNESTDFIQINKILTT